MQNVYTHNVSLKHRINETSPGTKRLRNKRLLGIQLCNGLDKLWYSFLTTEPE
jgi:hypothetical protein